MSSRGRPRAPAAAAARESAAVPGRRPARSYREKGLAARFRAGADVACTDLAQVVAVGRSDPAWGVRRDGGDSEGGRNVDSRFSSCSELKICSPWAVGVIVGRSRIERVANGQTLNPSMLTSLKRLSRGHVDFIYALVQYPSHWPIFGMVVEDPEV
uniref:Uncharacterized protein n=1 Tax=Oryza meridionalis TaxID=40149 RepID=A0A0E0D9E9_9ORYZ